MPVKRERRFTKGRDAAGTQRRAVRDAPTSKRPQTRLDAREPIEHQMIGGVGQPRVGMQKQQHIAGGDFGAGIHLHARARARAVRT